jgi:glycosyltransferase involved in cell wall biosynthesis
VLSQTYRNLEIIIIDDGSNDGTREYLGKLEKLDLRVVALFNSVNGGACKSRNRAINGAKGLYITGLDDDDYMLANNIESFASSALYLNRNVRALFTSSYVIKENGKTKKISRRKIIKQEDLLLGNYIGNQLFTKTDYLKKIGGFDENLKVWQDLECWYRLLEGGNALRVNSFGDVIDMSHLHERISTKKAAIIEETCDYFITKHKLSGTQIFKIRKQVLPYMSSFNYLRKFIESTKQKDFSGVMLVAYLFSRNEIRRRFFS